MERERDDPPPLLFRCHQEVQLREGMPLLWPCGQVPQTPGDGARLGAEGGERHIGRSRFFLRVHSICFEY